MEGGGEWTGSENGGEAMTNGGTSSNGFNKTEGGGLMTGGSGATGFSNSVNLYELRKAREAREQAGIDALSAHRSVIPSMRSRWVLGIQL